MQGISSYFRVMRGTLNYAGVIPSTLNYTGVIPGTSNYAGVIMGTSNYTRYPNLCGVSRVTLKLCGVPLIVPGTSNHAMYF